MRILHTSDWHVGRSIRGRSRADEQRAVLGEVVEVARSRDIDLAVVAGDLFDSGAPAPESEDIVYRALMGLVDAVGEVVIVAGNHDNPRRLEAIAPLLKSVNVHCGAFPVAPDAGGVLTLKPGRDEVRVALLPFVSQRAIVRAVELMEDEAAEHTRTYEQRIGAVLDELAKGFDAGSVNVVVAHASVVGGGVSGSERQAHVFDYYLQASTFPALANYVALGHFHRCQQIPGPGRLWYSGSPLQLDFGEAGDEKCVLIADLQPGLPATVEKVRLTGGRNLRVVSGSEAQIVEQGKAWPNDYLRAAVEGPRRAGMADELREQLPNLVEVRIAGTDEHRVEAPSHVERSPAEMFEEYLEERRERDERVLALFRELLEDVDAPATT